MSSQYTSSILVTGGTQGLGYYAAVSIAHQCPDSLIIVASRSNSTDSATAINKATGQKNAAYMSLDLGTMANVRDFVARWEAAKYPPIRALVFNAGLQFPGDTEYSADGVEKHIAINHVGHALLFHLLTPHLTPDARIVVVSSGLHDPDSTWPIKPEYTTAEQVAHPSEEDKKKIQGRSRYATSKAANAIWTNALARQLEKEGKGKTVVSIDPGLMPATGLTRDAAWPLRFFNKHLVPILAPILLPVMRRLVNKNIWMAQDSGASLAWLAVGEECKTENGKYYEQRTIVPSSKQSNDAKLQDDLWDWTVNFVAKDEAEKERFNKIE